MSFLNPWMLLGLLGAAVPIIIHLIHKRRPRAARFAAIELVLRSVDRVERRWRLRRFLLLAARVSLLALLAFAAAGPVIGSVVPVGRSRNGPERVALVVDASLSMRAVYGGDSAFVRAVRAARNFVDRLGPEDQATVIVARREPTTLFERPTGDRRALLQALEQLEPTYERGDLGRAITVAAETLGRVGSADESVPPSPDVPPARVLVFSDLAEHALETGADLSVPGQAAPATLELIDALEGVDRTQVNHALTALESVPIPGEAPRTVELRTRVQSFRGEGSDSSEPVDITLMQDGSVLTASHVDVVPGTMIDKALRHAFDRPGFAFVQVRLQPDLLTEDDVRYHVAEIRQPIRTLIIDGAPSGLPKEDEVFYLDRALLAGASDQPRPKTISTDELSRTDLTAFDVVVMAGVDAFGRSEGARLVEFVERGGGLLITASEGLDVDDYNAGLGPVLPRPFRGLKVVDEGRGGVGSHGEVGLTDIDTEHPVLEVFRGEAATGLSSTRTQAYLLLQPGGNREMRVWARYDDGQPALVETTHQKGRVVVLTTSIDRDLTDLPIRPAFLPLVRQTLLYLGDALHRPDPRRTTVAEPRTIAIPPQAQNASVIGPDGKEQTFSRGDFAAGSLRFGGTELPGHYRVQASFTGAPELLRGESFAVNVDPRESNLGSLDPEEATALLLGESGPTSEAPAWVRASALAGQLSAEALLRALLIAMVIAFVLESILTTQRIGR